MADMDIEPEQIWQHRRTTARREVIHVFGHQGSATILHRPAGSISAGTTVTEALFRENYALVEPESVEPAQAAEEGS